jgi:hypothetical protein
MRKLLKRKWLIPIAALILTLTIGAAAWAATGPGSTDSTTAPSSNTPSTTAPSTTQPSGPEGFGGPCRGRGDRLGTRAPLTDEQKQALQQEQQARKAERDAALKLIRDKMSASDQATFDQLQATAAEQRTALQQAEQNLRATSDQLRALVQKYGGIGATTPGTEGGASTTTGSSGSI